MKTLLILAVCCASAAAGCLRVATDRIRASDLAAAIPAFQGLDANTSLGFAPLPGTRRLLSARQIRMLARRNELPLEAGTMVPDLCIEREVHPIARDALKSALVAALGVRENELELLDFSNEPVPPGKPDFSRSGLNRPPPGHPDAPAMWRGKWVYDGGRSLSVWAKVRVLVERTVCVAAEALPAQSVIRIDQIREVQRRETPPAGAVFESAASIAGKVARHSIAAGREVTPDAVEDPKEVTAGETMRVTVVDGSAVISFDGVADSAGGRGDTILGHNPATGRHFHAVIEDKGKVTVKLP